MGGDDATRQAEALRGETVEQTGTSQDPVGTTQHDPRALQVHIGARLRRMFDEVVEEPIPDKLRVLLESLEQKSQKSEE